MRLRQETAGRFTGGTPSAHGSSLLEQPFAVARADSVGGFVLLGFESTGTNRGNLLILQGPRRAERLECAELGQPCHGRYLVGVQDGSSLTVERRFEVISGHVTPSQIGPDRFRGTFSIALRATDTGPNGSIVIENGTIDVPFVSDTITDGAIACLLQIVGAGAESCRGG